MVSGDAQTWCGSTETGKQQCIDDVALLMETGENDPGSGEVHQMLAFMALNDVENRPGEDLTLDEIEEMADDLRAQAEIEEFNQHLADPHAPVIDYERDNLIALCRLAFKQGQLCADCPLRPYGMSETTTESE